MSENIPRPSPGSPFPPLPPAAPTPGPRSVPLLLDSDQLRAMDTEALAREFARIMATAQGRRIDEAIGDPVAEDGTPILDSMTAVFLVAIIGKAVGRQPLINLGRVDRDALRSAGGLARLLHSAIRVLPAARGVA
jgi:hypothetical protein